MRKFFWVACGILSTWAASAAQAQEMCMSCNGTYFTRGKTKQQDQVDSRHLFGFCFDKTTMAMTFDSVGFLPTNWTYAERKDQFGVPYHYWRKVKENAMQGPLSEQIELSDVQFGYQYTAKDAAGTAHVALNGQCVPVQRIGR